MTTPVPLFLLDPELPGPSWTPFEGVRPLSELRAGAWRIRDRWSAALRTPAVATIAPHAADFEDVDACPVRPPDPVSGPAVVARSIFVPLPGGPIEGAVRRLTHGGETVAWFVRAGEVWTDPHEEGPSEELDGLLMQGTWDLITALERLLAADCRVLAAENPAGVPPGTILLGPASDLAWQGAIIEPGAILDTREGPIVLDEGVTVRAGTRLEGPLYAGPGTILLGGTVRQSCFGPQCRVHGEVSASVFLGYANKSHDGFVGHSVLGHWVNLGAGTITSNLKNTYGPVRLDLPHARVETGRTNLGSLIGDHAKTAIGTLFATGTLVGAGASVHGTWAVPRYVRPFAWGADGAETVEREQFVRLAGRVMPRRGVELTPERERSLLALHDRLAYPGPRLHA